MELELQLELVLGLVLDCNNLLELLAEGYMVQLVLECMVQLVLEYMEQLLVLVLGCNNYCCNNHCCNHKVELGLVLLVPLGCMVLLVPLGCMVQLLVPLVLLL